MVNETMRILYVRFHGHVGSGGGSKYVENGSNRLKLFIHNLIADSRKVFRFKNDIFVRAYVKDTANSMQTFPSQKLRSQMNPRYLNFFLKQNIKL